MPKYDLAFDPPLMNAAGSLGFALDPRGLFDLANLGAFITNPISLKPRTPARERRCLPYPGGFLLHSGYPNPGNKAALRRYGTRWARSQVPVIVHLLAESRSELAGMIAHLESIEGVMGIELGFPPESSPASVQEFIDAASGELPLIARLPLDRAVELASALVNMELDAVSLGPPRGALLDEHGGTVWGRLIGPGLFPLALAAVQRIRDLGLPVIGAGGVYSREQAEALLAHGAMGVQLDGVFWRLGWKELRAG